MTIEIWINARQLEPIGDGRARRLTAAETDRRALGQHTK